MARPRVKGIVFDMYGTAVDVVGAKTFGLKVCWINRSEASLDPLGPKPDLIVKSFDDLVQAL